MGRPGPLNRTLHKGLMWTAARRATVAAPLSLLVIVDDPEYCRAGAAFDVRNFPHVSCRGETVQHREVERRPIGSEFGTGIAERRWGLAGDLHRAVRPA